MNTNEARPIPQEDLSQKEPRLALIEGGRGEIERIASIVSNNVQQGLSLTAELSSNNTEKPTQDALGIKELMKTAKRVRPQHNGICQKLSELSSGEFHEIPVKKEERIWVKVEDLEGDINRVLDVVRSRIEFDNIEDLYKAVQLLHGMTKVVRVKDRFASPAKSGYRDILFNLEFTDPKTGKKHVTELQFQLKNISKVKGREYKNYMSRRDMEAELETLRVLNGDPDKIKNLEVGILFSLKESQEMYEGAWSQHKNTFESAKEAMSA